MKIAEAPYRDDNLLLELLEDTFAEATRKVPGGGELPEGLWDRALLGPLRDFLSRPGKAMRARMVELGYLLGGGEPGRMPRELPALIEILHAGSLIVDDIEDDSHERRGAPSLHRLHGVPIALNAGNWLYFWPQALLGRIGLPAPARLQAHERIARCLLRCHEGQALDLTARIDELRRADVAPVARTLTTLKTGELLGLATWLGALCTGAAAKRTDALARFGCNVGIGLQMLDDLSGVLNAARRDKAIEDLELARVTWVWAWLSEELDRHCYREAVERLRALRAGDDLECDALLSIARFRLGMAGPRRTRAHFGQTLRELAEVLGEGAWCEGVRAELDWLERKFLEGA